MPVYPFKCSDCTFESDYTFSMAEYEARKSSLRCPHCECSLTRVFTPVALKTDTRFFSGSDDGFGNDNRSRAIFRRKCAEAGVPVTGKYFPQLCRPGKPLDPFAQANDTGEIKKKLSILGRGAEGSINMKPREAQQQTGPYRVADDIVDKAVSEKIRKEKLRVDRSGRQKLRESVREELTPLV